MKKFYILLFTCFLFFSCADGLNSYFDCKDYDEKDSKYEELLILQYQEHCKENTQSKEETVKKLQYYSHSIKDNKNDDGLISSGETIYMDIAVYNSSDVDLQSVDIRLSSSSSYVVFPNNLSYVSRNYRIGSECYATYQTSSDYSYGKKDATQIKYNTNGFEFTVSDECPSGTKLPFILTMEDEFGNRWVDDFFITTSDFDADLIAHAQKWQEIIGEQNGKINAGDTIGMDICVYNRGLSRVNDVKVSLSSVSSYISFNKSSSYYGDIASNCYKTYGEYHDSSYSRGKDEESDLQYLLKGSSVPFDFAISTSCPPNTTIPISVTIKDNNGNGNAHAWKDTFYLICQ